MIYYNEFDPKVVDLLWELIDMGMIGRGIVDDRSIIDVDYRDLYGFDQHHFFAGIGGWSYALRLAGWPDEFPSDIDYDWYIKKSIQILLDIGYK